MWSECSESVVRAVVWVIWVEFLVVRTEGGKEIRYQPRSSPTPSPSLFPALCIRPKATPTANQQNYQFPPARQTSSPRSSPHLDTQHALTLALSITTADTSDLQGSLSKVQVTLDYAPYPLAALLLLTQTRPTSDKGACRQHRRLPLLSHLPSPGRGKTLTIR